MSRSTNIHNRTRRSFVGKYVLDSLSFGMYSHPFMILREYIQNSVDAIDEYLRGNDGRKADKGLVDIVIDGRRKSIKITDSGIGIPSRKAWHVLHDLGRSEKDGLKQRGFRGIGRLGGLGYCGALTFTTKAEREDTVSTSVWDCSRIRGSVDEKSGHLDVAAIVEQAVTFRQDRYSGSAQDHFFSVELDNVRGFRGMLLNVPAIKGYLSQVAPVPFRHEMFRFGNEIDIALRQKVPSYETYCIRVNDEVIYKPYCDRLGISQHGLEEIKGVRFCSLSNDIDLLAFCWLGELDLLGTIWPSSLVDGLRLRSGNILIGDKENLSDFYREKRFNNYMVGEVHVIDSKLLPNSRRDDFEDNARKDDLYSYFIRDIGLPYSRKIRELSAERSRQKTLEDASSLCIRVQRVLQRGYVAESQKQELVEKLKKLNGSKPESWTDQEIAALIRNVQHSKHLLSMKNTVLSIDNTNLLKYVFETIYLESNNKVQAEALISKILTDLSVSTTG